MTISSTVNRNNYVGTGAVGTYSYTFPVTDESELLVTVVDTDGYETTLSLTTDYTVTGAGESAGGTIVLVDNDQAWLTGAFLTTDYGITIRSVVPLLQETDISNQGRFYARTHENVFDRLVRIDQQQQDELDRSIKLPETESGTTMTLPTIAQRASMVLGFDADGEPQAVANVPTSGVSATAFAETLLDDETAADARTTLGFTGSGKVVATGDLADLAVTAGKLASDAVTTAKVLDANITEAKLAEAVRAGGVKYGGASAAGTDTYAVTPSPAFTAYATGMVVTFKADVANTAGATLNVNALGAKTLVDRSGTALETGAILAGQMVMACYDGTNFQVLSPLQSPTQVVKAWVTFDGTGTPAITDSFNVASITDHGTGEYSVVFTTAFKDTKYCVLGTAGNNDSSNQCSVGLWGASGKLTTGCRIRVYNFSAAFDATQIHVAFIGAR